jgi:hypothetical protein
VCGGGSVERRAGCGAQAFWRGRGAKFSCARPLPSKPGRKCEVVTAAVKLKQQATTPVAESNKDRTDGQEVFAIPSLPLN